MSRFQILSCLISRYKLQLVLTYVLFSLEMLGTLVRPFFLGVAIDDLIKGSYHGLIELCAIQAAWLIIGTVRHMYDTRTYSAIYVSLVTQFISRQRYQGDVSKLSAHSNLAREFIDFLEFDLVYVIEAVYNILGSLILLYYYDASVVILCVSVLVPVVLLSRIYGKRMLFLNKQKNDELEKQINIISNSDYHAVRSHYTNLRTWQIRISDQEAWNFGFMELFVLIVLAASLIITNSHAGTGLAAGSLVGIFFYVVNFTKGLDTIPYMLQRLSSLSDITRRINLQSEDIEIQKEIQGTGMTAENRM